MAERLQNKKQKTVDSAIKYFKDFLSEQRNEKLINVLRVIMQELNLGMSQTSVYFVHVTAANANSLTKFSRATISAEFIQQRQKRVVVPFAIFFARGFGVLSALLNKEVPKIPENTDERLALERLIQFLTNANEQNILKESDSEAALAIRLAQHLLTPLVLQKTFVIDSNPGIHSDICCSVEHPITGGKGDTSYGCPRGWHGSADVLLTDDKVPLSVVESAGEGQTDAVSMMSDSSMEEVKEDDNFSPDSISQVIAQTIVYSFVQHKRNSMSSNSLVPGIGLCSKKMVMYLYDCVEDVLLTTRPVDLHTGKSASGLKLNYRAVIILWLGLNYKPFGNTTPPEYKHCISNFHKVLGPEQLKMYQEESEQPFQGKLDEEDFFKVFNEAEEILDDYQDTVTKYVPEIKFVEIG